MQLPRSLHGPYRPTKAAAARAVGRMVRGAGLGEAFEPQGWVDTSRTPGLLVLHGPSPMIGGGEHYQLYLPLTEVFRAITARKLAIEDMESIFQQALTSPWGLLSLASVSNSIWTHPEHRAAPFLRSLIPFWDEFEGEGARYSDGSNTGGDLWTHASTVKGVLLRRGVRPEDLKEPPTASRLAELASGIV